MVGKFFVIAAVAFSMTVVSFASDSGTGRGMQLLRLSRRLRGPCQTTEWDEYRGVGTWSNACWLQSIAVAATISLVACYGHFFRMWLRPQAALEPLAACSTGSLLHSPWGHSAEASEQ